jgi:cobalt-zinc-cadmium efflux system protein
MAAEHNHNHNHDHYDDQHGHLHHHHAVKNLKTAFFLNLSFTIIEIAGGLFTNSIAILSDALHDLGDTLSIGFSWYFQKLSGKSRDQNYSYGYRRLSLVAAFVSAVILLTGSLFIVSESVPRLFNPESVKVEGMLLLAAVGVAVNGLAVLRLKKGESSNERVVMLHLLEDVLGWIAVLVGSVIMYFFKWPVVDPILSIMIAIFILWNAVRNIREFVRIFLQGIPKDVDLDSVSLEIEKIEKVKSVHDVHIWSMDGEYNVLSAHVVVDDNLPMEEIVRIKNASKKIFRKLKINHETLEFEYVSEACQFEDC